MFHTKRIAKFKNLPKTITIVGCCCRQLLPVTPKHGLAPLNAECVFVGGDDWFTLFCTA